MLVEDTIIRSHIVDGSEQVGTVAVEDVELVKKRCIEVDYPLTEEYDFRNDIVPKSLKIDLKPTTTIIQYQEICLNKMFGMGEPAPE